jgi:hypothetical protein
VTIGGDKAFDFNLLATFLEISSKLYDMKITMLYEDIIKMRSALFGKNAASQQKAKDRREEEKGGNDAVRRQRARRHNHVTQNPAVLNKPPAAHVALDPFFSKLANSIGNNSSSMLTSQKLPSINSRVRIPTQENAFWDSSDPCEEAPTTSSVIVSCKDIDTRGSNLRQTLKDFRSSNAPYEPEVIE